MLDKILILKGNLSVNIDTQMLQVEPNLADLLGGVVEMMAVDGADAAVQLNTHLGKSTICTQTICLVLLSQIDHQAHVGTFKTGMAWGSAITLTVCNLCAVRALLCTRRIHGS